MNIYKIWVDRWIYDTYDSEIIVANNKKEVKEITQVYGKDAKICLISKYTGREKKPFILLSSFNAS